MPTIEIVSFNSSGLGLNQDEYDVALIEENELRSHRGLFYNKLKKQNGVIIHIGNPDMKGDKEGGFFAGAIIDWGFQPDEILIPEFDENKPTNNSEANQQFQFKFLDQYKKDIDRLMFAALNNSPIGKACFLTDYQFGPEVGKTQNIFSISNFWAQHDKHGLDLNTMYEFTRR